MNTFYPSPSGSVDRYSATNLRVMDKDFTSVGVSTVAGMATNAVNPAYNGAVFDSNRTLSIKAGRDIVFTANQTDIKDGVHSGAGLDANGQYKSAVVPADLPRQTYLSNLCEWKTTKSCVFNGVAGTIIALAWPDAAGKPRISYGPCMVWDSAVFFLCCNFTAGTLGTPAGSPGSQTRSQTRTIPCGSGTMTQVSAYACPGPVYKGWLTIPPAVCASCYPPSPEVRRQDCPEDPDALPGSTFTGEITQLRTYTCPGPVAGEWKTIANTCRTHRPCKPLPSEVRTRTCSMYGDSSIWNGAYYSGNGVYHLNGVETQTRTWSCVNNMPVASEWATVPGTGCVTPCIPSGYIIGTTPAGKFPGWPEIDPATGEYSLYGQKCCSRKNYVTGLCADGRCHIACQ
ncbi:MAG: hypothetical protein PHP45_03615 [Elusimicrobiales bacterium]|nr:hypothetical protein [Elusimicrobiales bacterium]